MHKALLTLLACQLWLIKAQQWTPQTSNTTASLRGVSVVSTKIVWATGTKGTFVITTDGGATWSSPVATQSDEMLTLSAVSVGNKVFSVTTDTNGNVYLWQYTYGSASFDGPVTLANWKSGEGDASISTDGSSLFVAYSNATSVSFETSPNLGQTWSPPTVISNTETFIQTDSVNTSLLVGGVVDVVWTTQANAGATSYDVRFAQVSMNT